MTTPKEDPQMELWLNGEESDAVGRALDDLLMDGPDPKTTRQAVQSLQQNSGGAV